MKFEFRSCAGLNSLDGVPEVCDSDNLWQWSRLEMIMVDQPLLKINSSSASKMCWHMLYYDAISLFAGNISSKFKKVSKNS